MRKLCLFLIVAWSGTTIAVADQCGTWGCTSTVETLYTNANGYIYVSTPLDETAANCTIYPGGYFVLQPTAQNADKIYSSLLSAYMSNSKIQIRIVEGSPICEIAYVTLSRQH